MPISRDGTYFIPSPEIPRPEVADTVMDSFFGIQANPVITEWENAVRQTKLDDARLKSVMETIPLSAIQAWGLDPVRVYLDAATTYQDKPIDFWSNTNQGLDYLTGEYNRMASQTSEDDFMSQWAPMIIGGLAMGGMGGFFPGTESMFGAAAGAAGATATAAEAAGIEAMVAGMTPAEIAAMSSAELAAAGIPASVAAAASADVAAGIGEQAVSSAVTDAGSGMLTTPATGGAPGTLGSGTYGLDGAITSGQYVDPFSAGSITGGNTLNTLTPAQLQSVSAITGMDTAGISAAISGAAAGTAAPGVLDSIARAISNVTGANVSGTQLISGGLSALGGLLSGNAAQGAARTSADAQIEAARIAADAARFRPIGVTTRFGQSNFTKDAQGNVTGAGYSLTPDVKAQQDALMGVSNNMLTQYQGAQSAFAPMGTAGQRAMTLGNQYLATDPAAQAKKYMQEQQALLATGRERDMNQMLTGEFNRGTYGLATGGTSTGMGAANPRLEAMMNAQRQQDLGLAAQATQGGMDYAKFGAGMVGTGGDLTKAMYSGQTAAFNPYQTALTGAQTLEGLGQNALTLGMDLGRQTSQAASGGLLAQGMSNAAQAMQPANAYSPWGAMLSGAGNAVSQYGQPAQNPQYRFDPFTGRSL